VLHWEAPQLSQPEERNRPNSRLRHDSRPHVSQPAEQAEAELVQAGAEVVHESHPPQLECLNRLSRRLRQLSLSSQHPLSQALQPPQLEETAGAAGAAAAF
jgi:hypothetical protein